MSSYDELQRKPNRRRHRTSGITRDNQRQMNDFNQSRISDSGNALVDPRTDHSSISYSPNPGDSQRVAMIPNSEADALRDGHAQLSVVRHKVGDGTSSHRTTPSIGSTNTTATGQTNQLFYASASHGATPKAHTWKSQQMKQRQNFNRMVRLVGFIAPEQFRNQGGTTGDVCNIVPDTFQKYCDHEKELVKMREIITLKNVEAMKAQIATHKASGATKSKFGEKGKVYGTFYSPVLCQPTIWSVEYKHTGIPLANWPRQSELQYDGDTREQLKTRCGRYLPPPRFPATDDTPFYQQPFLGVLPLDQTGPIYSCGPSPIEVMEANEIMNEDADFELGGRELLGSGLIEELGLHYASAGQVKY